MYDSAGITFLALSDISVELLIPVGSLNPSPLNSIAVQRATPDLAHRLPARFCGMDRSFSFIFDLSFDSLLSLHQMHAAQLTIIRIVGVGVIV